MKETTQAIFDELYLRYPSLTACREAIGGAFEALLATAKAKGTVFTCGNGGSAADSEHIVGELLKKFSAGVRQQVNAGIPVFWGVTLGIYPERGVNPQSTGGHMRLIIGYNDKKKEILYTDTWGEGHELKRMPEDWAFAITHDAFFLKPR